MSLKNNTVIISKSENSSYLPTVTSVVHRCHAQLDTADRWIMTPICHCITGSDISPDYYIVTVTVVGRLHSTLEHPFSVVDSLRTVNISRPRKASRYAYLVLIC